MILKDFWKKREASHYKKLLKYLKYVFNDHFILFLFIFFGALAYFYSEYIKSLNTSQVWPLYVLGVLLAILPFSGQLASLLQPADKLYLIPMEEDFSPIMKRILIRSSILPMIILALASAISAPLLYAFNLISYQEVWKIFLLLVFMKVTDFTFQLIQFKTWQQDFQNFYHLTASLVNIILVFLFLFFSKSLALTLAGLGLILGLVIYCRFFHKEAWNWEWMIDKEQNRLNSQLKILNIFTDVVEVKSIARRNKYVDPLVKFLSRPYDSAEMFLTVRSFFRQGDYIHLYIRLSLLAIFVILILPYAWMRLVAGILFLFLIGFQIIPLAYNYRRSSVQAVFPLAPDLLARSVKSLIQYLLFFLALVLGVVGLFNTEDILYNLGNLFLFLIFTIAFSQFYVKRRLKRKLR